MTDLDRKRSILNYAWDTRKRFIKLLVLTRWASHAANKVHLCQRVLAFVDLQDAVFTAASDTLFRLCADMKAAREPMYDIATAIDVLSLKSFHRLPKIIQKKILPKKPLGDDERRTLLVSLQDTLRVRLLCDEVMPLIMRRNMKIANGRVTFTISGKFQVSLTLNSLSPTTTTSSTTTPPDPPSSPWTILDLKLLHASKLEEYPHIPVVLEKYQIQNLINIGQIKMAAAGEGTTATTTIDSSHSSSLPVKFPLVELYRYLDFFCLAFQLEILSFQLTYLIKTRWSTTLSSVFDRDNGKIIIEYWCKPRTPDDVSPLKVSHFIEIYIHTDTATTSSTLSDAAPSSTSSIVSKSYLPWFQTDGTSRRILVKCYSALVSVADAVIKTRHENNFMDGESSASGGGGGGGVPIDTLIHPTCIDVELLLKHVTKNHAKRILSKISSVVHSLDGIHASDFVDQDLQQQQQQQASSPQPIPEPPHGSPTQSHQVSEICLMATLAQKSWITFSVDIKTGKISISETTTLHQQQQSSSISSPTTPTLSKISATRLQLAEHIIRTNIENAWNALSFLRCSYLIDHIESMGTFIGMESVRKVPIADKSLLPRIETDSPNGDSSTSGGGVGSFQFPTEFSIHLRFKQFPTWLLQISLAEKREQPHQNRGGISSASSSPSMANKPLAVPPDAFVFAHSTSGSAVVSATFAAMDTPKSFVVFKIWLNEIVTAPSGGGNAGGAFLAKSIPISPADLHSVSSSSPSSSSVSSKFNSKIWSTFDFVDLSKAVEIARKHIVMARIVDKLSLLNIEHHRVKSHANILEVEKKWFSLMDGGWKIVEQADITTLSHEASESQSASPDQLQQQSSPTTRFSYSAALSSRLEAALALRLSLLFGLKNRYDQQQQHLYILPPDHLPFGNLYMLVKDVQTTGDKILFDFVAKLQLNSVILPPITEPDNFANGIEYNKKDFTLTLSLSRTSCAVAHMLVKFLPVTMIANVASQLFLRSSWLLSNNIKITSYNLNSLSVSLMDLVDLNLFWIGGISGAATRKIKFGGRFIVKLTFAHQLLDSNQSSSPSSSIPLYLNKLEEIAQIELNKDRDLIHLLDRIKSIIPLIKETNLLKQVNPACSIEIRSLHHFRLSVPPYPFEILFAKSGAHILIDLAHTNPTMARSGMYEPCPFLSESNLLFEHLCHQLDYPTASTSSTTTTTPMLPSRHAFVIKLPFGIAYHPQLTSMLFSRLNFILCCKPEMDKFVETLNTTSGISQVERVGPSSVKYTAADDISYLIDLDLFESPNVQILIAEHRAKDEICPMPLDKVELLGKSISSKLADFLEVSLTEKLKFVLDISLLPIAVLRDFVMMANIEVDERPDRRMEFCIRSPGSTMFSYLPPLGAFGVLIDRPNNRLQIMIQYTEYVEGMATELSPMILPISYNYVNGLVTIWRSDPELELLNTTNISMEESFKQREKVKAEIVAQAQAKRGEVPPLDKVMLQAAMKEITPRAGGPGKLYPVVNRAFTKLDIIQQILPNLN